MGGYTPPGINKLRTTLLQQEKTNVEKLLEPIKSTWSTKGVTIAADGWTDSQRMPLLNFIAVTESGPMFLKCENTEGKAKTKEYISALLIEVIEKVGSKNVVQVVTDNAANCKAAGLIIQFNKSPSPKQTRSSIIKPLWKHLRRSVPCLDIDQDEFV